MCAVLAPCQGGVCMTDLAGPLGVSKKGCLRGGEERICTSLFMQVRQFLSEVQPVFRNKWMLPGLCAYGHHFAAPPLT